MALDLSQDRTGQMTDLTNISLTAISDDHRQTGINHV
jgi:hypothetical protein